MDSALVIVIALVVVGLIVFVATRKKTPTLPAQRSAHDLARSARGTGRELPATERDPGSTDRLASSSERPLDAPEEPPVPADSADSGGTQVHGAGVHGTEVTAYADGTAGPSATPETESPEGAHARDVAALRKGLASTRGGFIARLAKLFGAKPEIDAGLLEEIEEVLITADVGVHTTQRILEGLREKMQAGALTDEDSVWRELRSQAEAILAVEAPASPLEHRPSVIAVVGVNGVGKTTTIGKLAARYTELGKKVLLAAGDTYRAAAVLQLEVWGNRVNCPVVKGKEGADPGSVIFDAIRQATDEGYDLVIADTAGRLHTKTPLMDELKKVERTLSKATDGRGADEVYLVLDSTTGQNAVQQMQMFRGAVGVTGVVLTKLDGTAKGGVILGIVDQHKLPVRFIGLGERVEDLREFDARTFVEALFAKPDEETMAA